jgi:hypothetical protein
MKKRKPKPAKRKASRDENQAAFDAVQRIIERTEKRPSKGKSAKSTQWS